MLGRPSHPAANQHQRKTQGSERLICILLFKSSPSLRKVETSKAWQEEMHRDGQSTTMTTRKVLNIEKRQAQKTDTWMASAAATYTAGASSFLGPHGVRLDLRRHRHGHDRDDLRLHALWHVERAVWPRCQQLGALWQLDGHHDDGLHDGRGRLRSEVKLVKEHGRRRGHELRRLGTKLRGPVRLCRVRHLCLLGLLGLLLQEGLP
mmetsp:Transcript_87716/g.226059  ORF Transcript_87716/g.226059 Transcript_87716/m.226059 type:complete len:206 (+) Transcript_87716:517-1134(+)